MMTLAEFETKLYLRLGSLALLVRMDSRALRKFLLDNDIRLQRAGRYYVVLREELDEKMPKFVDALRVRIRAYKPAEKKRANGLLLD